MSPLSGLTSPARIRSSVDLPEPFGPISPMRSPSETVNQIFWNSGLAPKAFEMSCALMIGGNDVGSPDTQIQVIRKGNGADCEPGKIRWEGGVLHRNR